MLIERLSSCLIAPQSVRLTSLVLVCVVEIGTHRLPSKLAMSLGKETLSCLVRLPPLLESWDCGCPPSCPVYSVMGTVLITVLLL